MRDEKHDAVSGGTRRRVCRNDSVRRKVNQMLAMGAPYAGIVRALAADNAEFDDRNRIALDSIRTDTGLTPIG